MVVLVLERARARTDELNDKLRRLSLLTARAPRRFRFARSWISCSLTFVGSLGVSHESWRLLEGEGSSAKLVVRAAVGFDEAYLAKEKEIPVSESWAQRVLKEEFATMNVANETDKQERDRMLGTGVKEIVSLVLRGKDAPLGIFRVGSGHDSKLQDDEVDYLKNIAQLAGPHCAERPALLNRSTRCSDNGLIHLTPSATRSSFTTGKAVCCASTSVCSISPARKQIVGRPLRVGIISARRTRSTNNVPIARALRVKETIPIPGCPAISWRRTRVRRSCRPPDGHRARLEGHFGSQTGGRKIPHTCFRTFRKACSSPLRKDTFWTSMTLSCALLAIPHAKSW